MVLLLRAFTNVDAYAEALELAGLDPYVVGGRGYWSSQQVTDALCLLGCVANPLDDEALLGALASPAAAVSPRRPLDAAADRRAPASLASDRGARIGGCERRRRAGERIPGRPRGGRARRRAGALEGGTRRDRRGPPRRLPRHASSASGRAPRGCRSTRSSSGRSRRSATTSPRCSWTTGCGAPRTSSSWSASPPSTRLTTAATCAASSSRRPTGRRSATARRRLRSPPRTTPGSA